MNALELNEVHYSSQDHFQMVVPALVFGRLISINKFARNGNPVVVRHTRYAMSQYKYYMAKDYLYVN